MVKWCHLSDVHLGYKQYNLIERYEDFIDAFNTCIELIIEKHPDFVILPGDLFEHFNPKPATLRKCIVILEKLKLKNIPIFVSRGNHDVSTSKFKRYGGDVLDLLQDLSLINYIKDDVVIVKKEGKEIALIAALGYYGKKSSQMLSLLLEKHKTILSRNDLPKILMLHAFLEDMITKGGEDLKIYTLNRLNFDYIAIGHYHLQWPNNYKAPGNKIFCSGATEHRSSLEWKQSTRGFYYVECDKINNSFNITPEFIEYNVRPKKRIVLDLGNISKEKAIEKISSVIAQNDIPDILLSIVVKGSLKSGEIKLIDTNSLKKIAKNALRLDIITDFTDSSTIISSNEDDIRETMSEIFKKIFNINSNDIPTMVSLVEEIINNVENKEFQDNSLKMIKYFERNMKTSLEKLISHEKKISSNILIEKINKNSNIKNTKPISLDKNENSKKSKQDDEKKLKPKRNKIKKEKLKELGIKRYLK